MGGRVVDWGTESSQVFIISIGEMLGRLFGASRTFLAVVGAPDLTASPSPVAMLSLASCELWTARLWLRFRFCFCGGGGLDADIAPWSPLPSPLWREFLKVSLLFDGCPFSVFMLPLFFPLTRLDLVGMIVIPVLNHTRMAPWYICIVQNYGVQLERVTEAAPILIEFWCLFICSCTLTNRWHFMLVLLLDWLILWSYRS